jgi:amidase
MTASRWTNAVGHGLMQRRPNFGAMFCRRKNTLHELIAAPAREVIRLLKRGEVSPLELLDLLEARIAAVEPPVNALPTLCFERARDFATELMTRPTEERGLLCGLPLAIKDLTEVEGVRTTFGSPIYADNISLKSDIMVERLEAEGAVVYAKSNTPEFGAGANTFNEVLGRTHNPWNLRCSAGGSSGGAAAALATGAAWLAQGSDHGGSLRTPASFCRVVGLRPSPGRVARGPTKAPLDPLPVAGPMARDILDCALFLDALSGWNPQDPLSLPKPPKLFVKTAEERIRPKRIAFSADLGVTPVEPEVAEICRRAAVRFESQGVVVEEAAPDMTGAKESYKALRAFGFALSHGDLLKEHPSKFKPEIVQNIEEGLALTVPDLIRAQKTQTKIRESALAFFQDCDLLLTPTAIVPPYPLEDRYITSCQGHAFEGYIDWLAIAYAITLVSLPSLSLPCGFTAEGLPVGLQMVGKPRGEAELLSAALLLEEDLALDLKPIDPRPEGQPFKP